MLEMEQLQGNELFTDIILNQFVETETLHNRIDEEKSIPKLSCLLQLLYERINRNLSKKRNFNVTMILEHECSFDLKRTTLYFALCIQADNREFKKCLNLFNEKLSIMCSHGKWEDNKNLSELLCIAAVIIEINLQLKEEFVIHVDKLKLKMFLLKLCGLRLSLDVFIDKSTLFFKYFEILISEDSNFMDETIQHFIEQENLDFLCLMLDRKLEYSVTSNIFHKEDLWNFLKEFIISDNNVKKKQAQYILWRSLEYFKTNDILIPEPLQVQSHKDWDFFFILLEMSKEKQLHLIQPTLKLLPSITKLHITWQICLYRELLKHSQLVVVYSIIGHILQLKFTCDQIHQGLLHYILVALNKFEYSNLSKKLFRNFEVFCNELTEDCCLIFFEEFLNIDWNPAAAWCVLTSASSILHKIPHHLIIKMMRSLKKLPHLYIKQSCIIFVIKKMLHNSCDILENFILIGKFLLSTDSKIDKEIFHQIIDEKRIKLMTITKNINEMFKKSIKEKNKEYAIVSMELMKKLNMEIDCELEIPHSNFDDIIVFYFPNILKPFDINTYLLQRFQNIEDDDYGYLLKFLEISFDNDLVNISSNECLNIRNLRQNNEDKRFIVRYLTYRAAQVDTFSIDSRLQAENDLKHPNYYHICKLWIKMFRKSFNQKQSGQQLEELIPNFLELLDVDDDNILKIIVDNLELITKYSTFEKFESVKVLDVCLRKLCLLPNNLMRTYCIGFFKSIFELNLFSKPTFSECWENWYMELFECYFMDCESLMTVIMEGCRKIIFLQAPCAKILTPLILSAINKGIVIQKNQRVEYGICQEIHYSIGATSIQNPNMLAMDTKMLSIECLYLIAKNKSSKNLPSVDSLMELLLDIYMKNYKKRYFPDSKIHLEKLRIVQAMLMLVYFTDSTREKLVQFILNSFCEESHQPSVKQLLQWLLIILVAGSSSYLRLIIEKIDSTSQSHPSSVVALIPVVYHLMTSLEDEEYWYQVTNALLPWTMGANFKLRAYSQFTLRNILRRAKKKQLSKYIERYSFLENTISAVIDATGTALTEILKNDLTFIETFDPNLHYTVENIFVALPRILDVTPSEWENVLQHNFSEKFDVTIENEHKLPSMIYNKNNDDDENVDELTGVNVQKKIIPWKQDLIKKIENNSLNSLICVASLVEKSSNLGGLSRTCEIFNVKQLILHNMKIKDDKEFKNLSMSSENWLDFMEVKKDDLSNFLIKLKEQGYSVVGLEQTSESVRLDRFKFEKKTVILLGNEKEGIPAPLLPVLDTCVEISQFGQTRSLNVHVAGATCIWEYVKQHLL